MAVSAWRAGEAGKAHLRPFMAIYKQYNFKVYNDKKGKKLRDMVQKDEATKE